ncbi:MAG: exo-alpha-sialidase, partial [Ignavibacterium sp.]|nr:exo-alpha-sialidase [Ignavibacterium sp.]
MNSNGIHISLFTLILVFLFTLPVYTQTADLKQIHLKYKDVKESASVAINDNELLFFFVNPTQDSIYSIRTTDLGSNWSQQSLILKFESNQSAIVLRIAAIKTNTNRIILSCTYSSATIISDSIIIIKSDDLGHSWSSPSKIKGGNLANRLSNKIGELVLTKSSSNTLYLSFNNRANHYLWFKKSIDDGQTWTDTAKTIYFSNYFTISDVNIFTEDDQNLTAIFLESVPGQNVLIKKSSDAGETWSETQTIFGSGEDIKYPRAIVTEDNKLWLVYQKELFYNLPYSSGGYTAYY